MQYFDVNSKLQFQKTLKIRKKLIKLNYDQASNFVN